MDKAIDQSDAREYLGGPRQVELQSYLRNQNSQNPHPQHPDHSHSQQRAAPNTNNTRQQQEEEQQQTSLSPSHNYSSRAHFRQLTRDILNLSVESTTEPTTTLEVPVTSLDPVKFDPMSSMRVPLVYDR